MIVPEIHEADVRTVCSLLGLPVTAFSGKVGADPRLTIIRSMDTLDIEACPGSGKTTLLVAKLAILAHKWTDRRRGFCVLSHTNVARREIEARLGNTAAGQGLLRYPHFIGTIHSFANEYLALPWLRSLGYPVEMIDDEVSLGHRWKKLSKNVRYSLQKNHYTAQVLRFRDAEFSLGDFRWGKKGWLGTNTPTYSEMRRACEESVVEGFYCHDEMFVWANDLLDKVPSMVDCLRARFPFLFLDEVQDNSEIQSQLLDRIFMHGDNAVTRQRLGDTNQAIYEYTKDSVDVGQDTFPIAEIRRDMPSSYRFDQSIADLLDPLAVNPQGLEGLREQVRDRAHVIFLFNDDTIGYVLERYAHYLLGVFSDEELREGHFTAIGAVHRPSEDDKVPRSIGQYWNAYDYEIGSPDPRPTSFVQYVAAGSRLAQLSGEVSVFVEKVAEGVLRLARISNLELRLGSRRRNHRYVLELLEECVAERENYLNLVREVCLEGTPVTRDVWEGGWRDLVGRIGLVIAGVGQKADQVQSFLRWDDGIVPVEDEAGQSQSDNIFRHAEGGSAVAVHVGSIHGAKGETHTATLVLDTFYRAHHLKSLKAWLTGRKSGGAGESAALQSRQRLHYVAMSRPSALLCLAMREDALGKGDTRKLRERGWKIARVTDTDIEWLKN